MSLYLDQLLYSPIFVKKIWNQKLKILSKCNIRLNIIDYNKIFFIMSSKYGNLLMVFFKDFYIAYSMK
jgi:hypothetical protein